ncbi:hypothetical protein GCM10010341_55550 [Streptomyces noursei]|nr:hypothetical protein GCM10010341_55550 [Streptomyces noursei]
MPTGAHPACEVRILPGRRSEKSVARTGPAGTFGAAPVTLGTANARGGDNGGTTPTAWPGGGSVTTADAADVFGQDLSGLYQEKGVMWGAQNSG